DGVGGIVKGGGNLVVGTLGIVTMPVFGAVGAVFRAFKPARKEETAKE
ncbi:MAG: hypothetical protein HQL57_10250, partial [Magnetococcales bacterium]|nr:hypothetical protein [Magnetococcales bacterium]